MKRRAALLTTLTLATVAAPASGQSFSGHLADAQRARSASRGDPRVTVLQALLFGDLTVSFVETPARQVFQELGTALRITIIGRYVDDRFNYGIDPETPITFSGEQLLPLDVLESVLEQCSIDEECTWQIRKGYLEVGTKARLSVPGARVIRLYPVDELIFEVPQFRNAPSLRLDHAFRRAGGYRGRYGGAISEPGGYGRSRRYSPRDQRPGARNPQRVEALIELVTETVEPAAWQRHGGAWATIKYHDGALIVNAPPFIHRQIGGTPRVPPPR